MNVTIYHADCLSILRELPSESVDSCVTDPPYGLSNTDPKHVIEALTRWAAGERDFVPEGKGFMGKSWDSFVPPPAVWDEVFRVLKPGGHLLAFAGSRTFDLMTLSVRFAGFEIRDSIAWLYGSGFPKSMDVSKAIDKAAGAEREVTGEGAAYGAGSLRNKTRVEQGYRATELNPQGGNATLTAPATEDAARWEGWGTALKPAFEPIVVARKPLEAKTVAANVLAHGTGALNIDASRVGDDLIVAHGGGPSGDHRIYNGDNARGQGIPPQPAGSNPRVGRWPANVILDESQAAALDEQSGIQKDGVAVNRNRSGEKPNTIYGTFAESNASDQGYGGSGGASRFFYVAKAPKKERPVVEHEGGTRTAHPTVKPLTLMRWLVRLITPPGGTVLEPFPGSGTTVEAAVLEGFDCIAIEREAEYLPLIAQRLERNGAEAVWVLPEPEPAQAPVPELSWEEKRVAAYWCTARDFEPPHPRGSAPGCSCAGQAPEILPETEPIP